MQPRAPHSQAAMPSEAPAYTVEEFSDWTHKCGVREVQEQFELLAADAQLHGRTVLEEMQARGFKTPHEFATSCPEFPLVCWPSRLAELGVGTVLYFHFLIFLGLTLFTMFLLHLPMISIFGQQNIPGAWGNSPSWGSLYDFDGGAHCRCSGASTQDGGYGSACSAWDSQDSKCAGAGPHPQWCCNAWCYASVGCPTVDNDEDLSLSNRFMGVGLVRAYSACDQAAAGSCVAGVPYTKEAFSEGVVAYDNDAYTPIILRVWTPGRWGPNGIDRDSVLVIYLAALVVLCVYTTIADQLQVYVDHQADADTTHPNDFAVLVSGLPTTATDEAIIRAFFEEHAVRAQRTEVVKIVIGWDVEEFREKLRNLKGYQKSVDRLPMEHPQIAVLQEKIAQVKADLQSTSPEVAARMGSSGIVLVVFRRASDMRCCLERWTSFWARWFYCDAEALLGPLTWRGDELPRYPIGNPPRPLFKLSFQRAANPGDIHWEELGVDARTKRKRFAMTNLAMAAIIFCSFAVNYWITLLQSRWTPQLRAVVRTLMNVLLTIAATILGEQEYHETWTSQEFSQSAKMAVGTIANTGLVAFLTDITPEKWYEADGLVADIFLMILIQALLMPWVELFDVSYWLKCVKRRQLTQERVDDWNARVQENAGAKGLEQRRAILGVQKEVDALKRTAFSPSMVDWKKRYAAALKVFFCCLFFNPVLPLVSLVGTAGLILQYWVDKHMMLRWNQRSERFANCLMARYSTGFVQCVAPACLTLSFLIFLTPSWENKPAILRQACIGCAVSIGFGALPFSLLRGLWTCRCTNNLGYKVDDDDLWDPHGDYYQAQYQWPKQFKYHKDHFMYKVLPEAVNPEFLSPDKRRTVGADAVKHGFADATRDAAASEGEISDSAGVDADEDGDVGAAYRAGLRSAREPYGAASQLRSAAARARLVRPEGLQPCGRRRPTPAPHVYPRVYGVLPRHSREPIDKE